MCFLPLVLLAGCGDGTGPASRGTPGIRIVSGADLTDTIEARSTQDLIIEVRDGAGRPIPGVVVRMAALWTPPGTTSVPTMRVAYPTGLGFGWEGPLDEASRARVAPVFGGVAGPAGLEIRVPSLGLVDTAHFTVLPGNPVRVVAEPGDTVVAVGGTARVRGSARDRRDNPRPASPTWRVLSGAATATGDDGWAMPAAGFARVVATLGTMEDTVAIAAVPAGTISGFAAQPNGGRTVVLFDVDGTRRRTVLTSSATAIGEDQWDPSWSGAAWQLFFQHERSGNSRIYVADTLGSMRRLTRDDVPLLREYSPAPSSDGAWVYLGGLRNAFASQELFRVRPDGSDFQALATGLPAGPAFDGSPSPSPDGTRVAFVSSRTDNVTMLFVLDLASGSVTPLGVRGVEPRWSPDGEQIAYIQSDELRLIRPDGQGGRSLGRSLGVPFSWSPDGRWIVGRGDNPTFVYVDLVTGERARVPGTEGLSSPAWVR